MLQLLESWHTSSVHVISLPLAARKIVAVLTARREEAKTSFPLPLTVTVSRTQPVAIRLAASHNFKMGEDTVD